MEIEQQNGVDNTEAKSGWADSMAKILGSTKPKNKRTLILSRAKKDFEIIKKLERPAPSTISAPIQVVNTSGNVEDDDVDIAKELPAKKPKIDGGESVLSVKAQRKLDLQHRKQLREWENISRGKPNLFSPIEKSRERELVRIATKGVVQLFNAVNLQQKALRDKLQTTKKSEFKKDKVLYQSKEIFDSAMIKSKKLGTLSDSDDDDDDIKEENDSDFGEIAPTATISFKSSTGSISTLSSLNKSRTKTVTPVKSKRSTKPGFKALQDDYMIKDWNKDGDDESE